jgi:hypothetical protein
MAYQNKVLPITLSSINSATFTGAYQLLSAAAGLPHSCTQLHIANNADVSITISYDGVNDHDFLLAATDRQLYFQSNALPQGYAASLAQGTKVYVKGSAGTGLVYLSGWYSPINS